MGSLSIEGISRLRGRAEAGTEKRSHEAIYRVTPVGIGMIDARGTVET